MTKCNARGGPMKGCACDRPKGHAGKHWCWLGLCGKTWDTKKRRKGGVK